MLPIKWKIRAWLGIYLILSISPITTFADEDLAAEVNSAEIRDIMALAASPSMADTAGSLSPMRLDLGFGILNTRSFVHPEDEEASDSLPQVWAKVGLFYPLSLAINYGQDRNTGVTNRAALAQWTFFERPYFPAICFRPSAGVTNLPDGLRVLTRGGELAGSWGFKKISFFTGLGLFNYRFLYKDEDAVALNRSIFRLGIHYQLVPASLSAAGELSRLGDQSTFIMKIVAHI